MVNTIEGFNGDFRFLSNFYPCSIIFEGIKYPSVEHAYQAAKTDDIEIKKKIANLPRPNDAKQIGKRICTSSQNWDKKKYEIMLELVRYKFLNNIKLQYKLLETNNIYLEETNWWGDTYWGVCKGKGENNLGKILMTVRDELKRKE